MLTRGGGETHASRTDEELVELARSAADGDMRSFDVLVTRHQSRVVANCPLLTGASADAEDLAQEVFVKAFYGLPRFEGRSLFRTWLQRIKVNHCLNFLKKQRGRTLVDVEDPSVQGAPALQVPPAAERALHAATDQQRIVSVLDSMSETLRVPLIMRDGDGLSYEEIARDLGLGLSAVKMRIKRAREEFRRHFNDLSAADRMAPDAAGTLRAGSG